MHFISLSSALFHPAPLSGNRAVPAWFRWSMVLVGALFAARVLWVVATLTRALPEGPWPVARFGLVALVVCNAPGLALLRFSRARLTLLETAVFVPATSLAASGLAASTLYFCGFYTRIAAIATLALFTAAGAWGAAPILSRRTLAATASRLFSVPPRNWVAPLLAALLVEGVFESAIGTPFVSWDAVVTWDRWAADAGARTGLGMQLLGGYPQLLPAIRSLFYKAAATPADAVLPAEHLLLHGFDAVFPAILALALFALGRRFRFPALLSLGLLSACDPFFAELAAGESDVPLAALAVSAAALLPPLAENRADRRRIAPLAILLFALVFAKGAGVVLGAALVGAEALRDRRAARRFALPSLLAAIALTLPYLAHQMWLAGHPASREASPFLVSLPLHVAHTRLFTPHIHHLGAMLRRLVAHRAAPAMAPPAAALALLGASLLLAIIRRRTRIAAFALLALLAFWFFTASYDWRNAFPALALGSTILMAAAFPLQKAAPPTPKKGRHVFSSFLAEAALPLGFLALVAAGVRQSCALGTLLAPVTSRWSVPKAACLPPGERHMAARPAGDMRNILFEAPWAARAKHIWTGDPLYRLLAPRGCYAIQANAWNDSTPGDLFIATDALRRPPKGFVQIAELRRTSGYRSIWMFRPDLARGLVLETPAPRGDNPPTRELFGASAARDPFSAYLAPVRDGTVVRLPNPNPPMPRPSP